MSRIIAALAFASVGTSAFGQSPASEPSCATLHVISDEAAERFASFRGEQLAPNHYKAIATLPPFEDCTITDKGITAVICNQTRRAGGSSQGAFDFLAAQVKACYPSWAVMKTGQSPPGLPALPGLEIIKVQMLVDESASPRRAVSVGLARDTRSSADVYALSLSFIALPAAPSVS